MSLIFLRVLLVIVGSFVIALGSTLMIQVNHLGLHPYDVLEFALTEKFGLTFGTWHWIVGGIMVVIAYLTNKKLPKIGVFLEAFLVGFFIDLLLWTKWIPTQLHSTILEYLFLISGITLVGIGTGIYIAADIGAGPTDWFSLALTERTGISYSRTTTITEVSGVIAGLLLSGPVFIGTLLFSVLYGPIMVYSLKKSKGIVLFIIKSNPYKHEVA